MTTAEKARDFLRRQAEADERCTFLLIVLSQMTNLSPTECQRRIEELAK